MKKHILWAVILSFVFGTNVWAFSVGGGVETLVLNRQNKKLGVASTSPWGLFSIETLQGTVGAGTPVFVIGDKGTSTPAMYVDYRHFVGFNTANPQYTVDISGNLNVSGTITGTVSISSLQTGVAAASPFYIRTQSGGSNQATTTLETLNTRYFTVTRSGNATSTPDFAISPNGYIGVASSTPFAMLSIQATSTNPSLSVSTSANVNHLILTAAGNLGIASSSPAFRLSVNDTPNGFAVNNSGQVVQGTWQATAVDEAYVDWVVTGQVVDFGGATSFEIPNGASNSLDAIGEIALDTTGSQLVIATSTTGTTGAVFAREVQRIYSGSIPSSTAPFFGRGFVTGESIPLPPETDGFTVQYIQCNVWGGTSAVINLTDATGNDTNTVTCDTATSTQRSLSSNNTFTAGEGTSIETGTVTGVPQWLNVSLFGIWTRE